MSHCAELRGAEAGHVPVPAFQSEPLLQPEYQIPQGVEANASSGAIALRKGLNPAVAADRRKLAELSDDDPVWDATAHYLAGLCVNLILIASPEKIGALRCRQSTIAGAPVRGPCTLCAPWTSVVLLKHMVCHVCITQCLAVGL